MWLSLPPLARETAVQAALGGPERTFRNGLRISLRTAALVVGAGCVAAILLALVGAAALGIVVLLLAPAALAVVHVLPPASGRRWLATYEHGFVDVVEHPGSGEPAVDVVRWSRVAGVELAKHPREEFALVLFPEWGAAEGTAAPARRLLLTGLHPRGPLITTIEQHLPGQTDPESRASWARERERAVWTTPVLGVAVLVTALIVAVLPDEGPGTSSASGTPATPRSYTTVIDSPLPPVYRDPSLDVADPYTTFVPDATFEYADVCTGTVFPGAPAYEGAPPHKAYISITPKGPEADDYLGDLSKWESDDVNQIQLVACVTYTLTTTIRRCYYTGSGKNITQRLRETVYVVAMRESKTGRTVARGEFHGAQRRCAEIITTFGGNAPAEQVSRPTGQQLQDTIGKYVAA